VPLPVDWLIQPSLHTAPEMSLFGSCALAIVWKKVRLRMNAKAKDASRVVNVFF
jgi:hypothetical protein